MADITLDEVVQLADKLTPEERQALIVHVQKHSHEDTAKEFDELFGLLVFDVDKWPEALTLRREDEYGDTDR